MRDVAIVGGGPAGLAAALVLGRARREATLFDVTPARNAAADNVRGFLTRDGTPPAELRRIARQELGQYPTIQVSEQRVDSIEPAGRAFRVDAEMFRRVLLCVGIRDRVPTLYRALWGTRVLQCPYCHAFEVADRAYAFLATKPADLDHAMLLRAWTKDVVLLASFGLDDVQRDRLSRAQIRIERRPLRIVEPEGDDAVRLRFDDGDLVRDRLFAHPPQCQTELVEQLKLAVDEHGAVTVDEHYETSVPGVHAAGDLMTRVHSAQFAAGNGAAAAYAVNYAVTLERVVDGSL
jgi:thioredoxin reductase